MPKKILYIDNRQYGHNADLHIEFIRAMDNGVDFDIVGYGNYLPKYIKKTYKVPIKSNIRKYNLHDDIDIKKSNEVLQSILKIQKPDLILTYNSNGSSYEVELDNIGLYSWVSEALSKVDIPKYHITTDYCRSGFREDQAKWFEYVGYSAAIFRHKESLKHPLSIPKYWLPFSFDAKKYSKNIITNIAKKNKKVGFIGAAQNASVDLYHQRIKAMNFLNKNSLLQVTSSQLKSGGRKVLVGDDYVKFITSNLFGLTCGGSCNFFVAKYIQIPAACSLLVCSSTGGLETFPRDSYILYDVNNLPKLLEDILFHIKNLSLTGDKISLLKNYVFKTHSHTNSILKFKDICS